MFALDLLLHLTARGRRQAKGVTRGGNWQNDVSRCVLEREHMLPEVLAVNAHEGRWRHFRHHLVVALVAASALTLLHHANLLNWLDSLSLRLVSNTHLPSWSGPASADPELPLVLLIGDGAYETEFAQASPLNRSRLQQLISLAAVACPAVLAVDLDLSPGPKDATLSDQTALDTALQALGQPQPCAANAGKPGLRLLLATPTPVDTPALVELKFKWMRQLCEAGVTFAFHDVLVSQGAVLRVDPSAPTLGVLAADMMRGSERPGHAANEIGERPCDQVRRGKEAAAFLRRSHLGEFHAKAARFSNQRPFNARFFEAETAGEGINTVRHVLTTTSALPSTLKPGELAGRAVFLGGGYGVSDRFATSFGERPGLLVHAASFYSLVHPVRITNDLAAYALEVVLGVLFGYLFHWGWASHSSAVARLRRTRSASWLAPYFQARGWMLANFGMLFGAVAAVVLGAATLFFPLNLWVNAGPIVLGVFVKSLLASRGGEPADATLPRPAARMDAALASVLILGSLALLLFGSH